MSILFKTHGPLTLVLLFQLLECKQKIANKQNDGWKTDDMLSH